MSPPITGNQALRRMIEGGRPPPPGAAEAAIEGTLQRLEGAFGTSFTSVRLHPDSPRAGGNIHALTEGEDVHFAPGRFMPGTPTGDRLIAHELAHVVQQRRGSSGGSGGGDLAEVEADLAADAASRGATFRPMLGAPTGAAQHYEGWEHRELGDAHGGNERKIRLPNGLELTYGQLVALSGDFARSPEALLYAPRGKLEAVLRVMERERRQAAPHPGPDGTVLYAPGQAEVNQNNADYELATTDDLPPSAGPALGGDANMADGPHGEVSEGEHIESGAPEASAGYLDLASNNSSHFSPENIRRNWIPKHRLALDLARSAFLLRQPGKVPERITEGETLSPGEGSLSEDNVRPQPAATGLTADDFEAQAWLTSAFSDHYLTDAFASGHLVSGSAGRVICKDFYKRNAQAIVDACWKCASPEGNHSPIAAFNDAPEVFFASAAAFKGALDVVLWKKGADLLLKTVHDHYNARGVEARNARGQVWTTFGDANLGGHPETIEIASLASKASRDAVQDVLTTGGSKRASAALDYIPKQARLPGGEWKNVDEFATDPKVWEPVLALSLSPDPATNRLYAMIKGNAGPITDLQTRKADRFIQQTSRALQQQGEAVIRYPGNVSREWRDTLERGIRNLYLQGP